MKNINDDPLATPVYLKTEADQELPKDKLYYLLTRDGLFLCRNHLWFKSCVPAKRGPGDLAEQKECCTLDYPAIPRVLIEKAVGFFAHIYEDKGWESALVLVWNRQAEQLQLLCPDQKASAGTVKFNTESLKLPAHLQIIGDLHSHGSWEASPSSMDEDDELKKPGLHFIVGHIKTEPPQFYCCCVVDGTRFKVTEPMSMFEDYIQRDPEFPAEWLTKITEYKYTTTYTGGEYGHYKGDKWIYKTEKEIHAEDREIVKEALRKFALQAQCPSEGHISSELFRETRRMLMKECDKHAKGFVKNWSKIKKGIHEVVEA